MCVTLSSSASLGELRVHGGPPELRLLRQNSADAFLRGDRVRAERRSGGRLADGGKVNP